MYDFKTIWCPYITKHDRSQCVYAHNSQDFRRKPHIVQYQNTSCPQWKHGSFIQTYEEGGCPNGIDCGFCHGWKELEFHPDNYKQKKCTNWKTCNKRRE